MFLPKSGYLSPPVIIVLALIKLAVAATLALQAKFFSVGKNPEPQSSPSPIVSQSPSQSPDASREPNGSMETANWKTYTNINLGFSLKYPPEVTTSYVCSNTGMGGSNILGIKNPNEVDGTECYDFLAIWAKSTENSDLEHIVNKDKEGIIKQNVSTKCIVDNYPLGDTALIVSCNGKRKYVLAYFIKNNRVITILSMAEGQKQMEYEKISDQILSTFQFLE